jgi:hypothetical protein
VTLGRTLPESAYLALKAATRRLIKAAGGVDHVTTRVKKSTLSDYGNIEKPECFATIDVIADLEADVGEPIVSEVLAQLIEDGKRPAKDAALNPVAHGAEVMMQLGRFTEEALKTLADGHIDDHELKRLISESEQLRLKADQLHDHLCQEQDRRRVAKP